MSEPRAGRSPDREHVHYTNDPAGKVFHEHPYSDGHGQSYAAAHGATPAPLNVERLARALVRATREQAGEPNGEGWPGYVSFGKPRDTVVTLVVGDLAAAIARAYAEQEGGA